MDKIPYHGFPVMGGLPRVGTMDEFQANKRAAEECEIKLEVYYYTPLAKRPVISKWIAEACGSLGDRPSHLNCCFINWSARLAQQLRAGTRKPDDLKDGEKQVMQMLRNGFPVTNAEEYLEGVKYYVGEVLSKNKVKLAGLLKEKDGAFQYLDEILKARYTLWTNVFDKEEREAYKEQYGVDVVRAMISEVDWRKEGEEGEKGVQWCADVVVGL